MCRKALVIFSFSSPETKENKTGVCILLQDTRQTGDKFSIFTHQIRKQLAKNIETPDGI
jgi:hypothetical protein